MIIKKLYERRGKMIARLFCLLCLFILSCTHAYGLINELQNLRKKLHSLHQSLQQPLLQEPQQKHKKFPPSIVRTATPIWDDVKNLYENLKSTEIRNIENAHLKEHLIGIFRSYNNSFNNLAHFEHDLQKFITFANSKKSQGEIKEPQEFINLLESYNKLFGKESIEYLKGQMDWLHVYAINHIISERDKVITKLFILRLSLLIDTTARKIMAIAEDSIRPAYNKNHTAWEGIMIQYPIRTAQQGPRPLTEWFFHLIFSPLYINGLTYWSQKNTKPHVLHPDGLNSGHIDKVIRTL